MTRVLVSFVFIPYYFLKFLSYMPSYLDIVPSFFSRSIVLFYVPIESVLRYIISILILIFLILDKLLTYIWMWVQS